MFRQPTLRKEWPVRQYLCLPRRCLRQRNQPRPGLVYSSIPCFVLKLSSDKRISDGHPMNVFLTASSRFPTSECFTSSLFHHCPVLETPCRPPRLTIAVRPCRPPRLTIAVQPCRPPRLTIAVLSSILCAHGWRAPGPSPGAVVRLGGARRRPRLSLPPP